MIDSAFLKYPYLNAPAVSGNTLQGDELIEVTDSFDQPLLLVPRSFARRRRLPRRVVQVCLKDADGRIFGIYPSRTKF